MALVVLLSLAAALLPAGPRWPGPHVRHARQRCADRLVSVVAAEPPLELDSLRPGTPLERCEVMAAHKGKLFLAVPVARKGRRGVLRPLHAQLNLPSKHPAAKNPAAMVGKRLTVYVRRANVDDGTLHVSVSRAGACTVG